MIQTIQKDGFILASASPRRAELLATLKIPFKIEASQIDESILQHEQPITYLTRIARQKAQALQSEKFIVAADTAIIYQNIIIGKPIDAADAIHILEKLSGETHQVITAVSVFLREASVLEFYACTDVTFYPLSKEIIAEYVATGQPFDKAGAYGIQDPFGIANIADIKGDYYNVMGFPVSRFLHEIKSIIF